MTSIVSYRDLDAYKKGYQLALQIYQVTRHFPADERYGLTDQLRRAAVSIPSNIAEGYRRCSRTDYVRFLKIAFGSCGELETQLDICRDIGLIGSGDHDRLSALSSEVSKILNGLIRSLRQSGLGSQATI
jgi:four helix bundle protein